MKKLVMVSTFVLSASFFIWCFLTGTVSAAVLWTNGDPTGGGGSNEINTDVSHSQIYEDFFIPIGETWQIEKLWSNNCFSVPSSSISTAKWEIRSGMSTGDGGTLIASGTASADLTFLGEYYTQTIWNVAVSTDITLTSGEYWLSVTPIGTGSGGQSFAAGTTGTNGVNPVLNKISYWDSRYWGTIFEVSNIRDYSFGVEGTIVPVPGTLILLGSGLIGLVGFTRKPEYVSGK